MQGANQSEAELSLGLLRAVHKDRKLTQRSAAKELGVALGLVNTYLKRCAKKGLIKIIQAPSSRYMYYLTPKGFSEKSRLTAEFLRQSLSLFRQAQQESQVIMSECTKRKFRKIVCVGASDLTEIVALYARDYPISVKGVVDGEVDADAFSQLKVFSSIEEAGKADAYVRTALKNPQPTYDALARVVDADRLFVPAMLDITLVSARNGKQHK